MNTERLSEVSNLCRLAGRNCASILTARDVSLEAGNVGDVAFSWWLCGDVASTAAFATHKRARSTQYPGMPKISLTSTFLDWKPGF